MTAREKITVLIVSGYRPLREALRELFEHEGIDVVGESSSEREAAAVAPMLTPRVAVIDEHLPDGHARSVCTNLSQNGTQCVVLLSWHPHLGTEDMPDDAVLVLRDIANSGLLQAVREAARRGATAGASTPGHATSVGIDTNSAHA